MFYSPDELTKRAETYCRQHQLQLVAKLGQGMQGLVFATNHESAIKIHAEQPAYSRERDAYLRLSQHNVRQVRGLIVPVLKTFDDKLLVIEMTLVSPPFVVDFGGAYLNAPPPYETDIQQKAQWIEEKSEQFGSDWPNVSAILAELEELYGIFVSDVNPGNIRFSNRG